MHSLRLPFFFFKNSTRAPPGDWEGWIEPILMLFSINSLKVCSSSADKEYMGPRGGTKPSSIQIARS